MSSQGVFFGILAVAAIGGALYLVNKEPHAKVKPGEVYFVNFTTQAPDHMIIDEIDPVGRRIRIHWASGNPGGWLAWGAFDGLFDILAEEGRPITLTGVTVPGAA